MQHAYQAERNLDAVYRANELISMQLNADSHGEEGVKRTDYLTLSREKKEDQNLVTNSVNRKKDKYGYELEVDAADSFSKVQIGD